MSKITVTVQQDTLLLALAAMDAFTEQLGAVLTLGSQVFADTSKNVQVGSDELEGPAGICARVDQARDELLKAAQWAGIK